MAEENENTVQEKPSTHNKKGQQFIFGGIVLLLVLVAISSFVRLNSGTKIETEKDDRFISERSSAEQDRIKFEERFKRARNENLRGSDPTSTGETYDELIARLKRELEEAKQQPEPVFGKNPLTSSGSGKGSWEEKELERVRASRYDNYKIDLGFDDKNNISSLLNKRVVGTNTPTTKYNSSIERVLAGVDSEIERVSKVRERLLAGNSQGGTGSNPLASTGSFNFDEARNAGQSAANSPEGKPLPGQKELPIGTVIRTMIDQKVMSDYPGSLRLQVTHDVYDITRKYLLIPAGSICTARSMLINNVNAPIQSRMGYFVKKLRLPDGKIVDFSKQIGLDREGIAAVEGDVNRHLMAQFLGVVAYALVANESSYEGTGDSQSSYAGQVGENAREQMSPLAQKYLNLVPTITLKPGDPVRIFIEEPVFVYPWATIRGDYVSSN